MPPPSTISILGENVNHLIHIIAFQLCNAVMYPTGSLNHWTSLARNQELFVSLIKDNSYTVFMFLVVFTHIFHEQKITGQYNIIADFISSGIVESKSITLLVP